MQEEILAHSSLKEPTRIAIKMAHLSEISVDLNPN